MQATLCFITPRLFLMPTYLNSLSTFIYSYLRIIAYCLILHFEVRNVGLKVRVGVREKVKSIPDWQNELREVIETWIEKKFDPRNKV